MDLSDVDVLLDENIDFRVVAYLRPYCRSVLHVTDVERSATDERVLEIATTQRRVLISQDSDFGRLIHRDGLSFFALVYLRPASHTLADYVRKFAKVFELPVGLEPGMYVSVSERSNGITVRVQRNDLD